MLRFLKSFLIIKLMIRLEKENPNDFSFGRKIRKVLRLYSENKKINKKEIFKKTTKS